MVPLHPLEPVASGWTWQARVTPGHPHRAGILPNTNTMQRWATSGTDWWGRGVGLLAAALGGRDTGRSEWWAKQCTFRSIWKECWMWNRPRSWYALREGGDTAVYTFSILSVLFVWTSATNISTQSARFAKVTQACRLKRKSLWASLESYSIMYIGSQASSVI